MSHCDVLVDRRRRRRARRGRGSRGVRRARVIIADENPRFGGLADLAGGTIDGAIATATGCRSRPQRLPRPSNVHVLTRTTAAGHWHHNHVHAVRAASPITIRRCIAKGAPRHRLWKVRAKQIVLATGAIERPIAFANNDRPGVMLATAARGYVERYGVAPGMRGVVFTNNDDAYRTALVAQARRHRRSRIVDVRADGGGALAEEARKAGIEIIAGRGHLPASRPASAACRSTGVKIAPYRPGQRPRRQRDASLPAISSPCPAASIRPSICGATMAASSRSTRRSRASGPTAIATRSARVGAANGTLDSAAASREGYAAGECRGEGRVGRARKRPRSSQREAAGEQAPLEPIWFSPATGKYNEGNKHFIDFQNDVTAADLELAQREGYDSVEHTKRYTTFGMATDQGKTSNINGLGVLAEATGKTIPEIGVTTFRPPYTPFSFGSIAGVTDQGAVPAGPADADLRLAQGAERDLRAGRPMAARLLLSARAGEDKHAAISREILAVRNKVGLLDASTLGKIEIKGPDAAEFLDRIYTNMFSTLKVGRCRYGLMMNELGFLIDDGVTVRLADDHFLMHTTSGGADRIAAWLEEWLQTEWTTLQGLRDAGHRAMGAVRHRRPQGARSALRSSAPDFDISAEAFPHHVDEGRASSAAIRCASIRISFSGELSYEVATPANFGRGLWDAILAAGAEFGIEAYGTEALHVLRAEKGYIVIGDETDGTVTPDDVGLDGLVSKKKRDFIGKRSLEQSFSRAPAASSWSGF